MLTLLTYHIKSSEDYDNLFDTIDTSTPHVVTLQDFIATNRDMVIRKFKEKGYAYVRSQNAFSRTSTEVIFSKIPIDAKTAHHTFFTKTKTGSSMTKNTVTFEDKQVDIFTAQLDDSVVERKHQLSQLFSAGVTNPRCVMCDNTRMKNWQERDRKVGDGFRDAWGEVGTNENKVTENQEREASVFDGNGVECEAVDTVEMLDLNNGKSAILRIL